MGLSKSRLERHDPLFFLQLLLPICRPDAADIEQDPRLPYYSNVMTWSQSYATKLGPYGHKFKEVMIPELGRFDGAFIGYGLFGGATDGAIYRRWKPDDAGYDRYIGARCTKNGLNGARSKVQLNGGEVMNWLGTNGYSATMTCRRDRLPSDIPRHFLHHEKTDPGSKPAKCARFSQPVAAVKVNEIDATDANDNKQYYTRVRFSMQSTSSTNFSRVNAMNENKKWIAKKDRGRVKNNTKRIWGNEYSKTTLFEDVRADRYCRLNVPQVQDLQQIIQVLALIKESCVGYGCRVGVRHVS
ncbi:hypothetical protein IV203_031823 [Nitzschia inconspicua]|uniref:Uncharacterized protein n=1 Tax=Nitzschia inconspicua TaxID=303405 RepID=A0A9K3LV03_9STRA|nr:hypothetical protein IV203_031823 [Nitzschia inconspicua]